MQNKIYGYISLFAGLVGCLLYATQFIWDWFGYTQLDKALYSIFVVFLMCTATGAGVAANKNKTEYFAGITFILFTFVLILIMIINSEAMMLSTTYKDFADDRLGIWTGLRMLTSVTSEDVNSLANFALGIRQLVRALFLVVPTLIATWGGLSVLTADSIDEAEGGILAIVAAFVVFIVVWIFKAIDIQLMFFSMTLLG
jgi:hypothetical protein